MKFLVCVFIVLPAALSWAGTFCFDWKTFSMKPGDWALFHEESTRDPSDPRKSYKFRVYNPPTSGPGPHCQVPDDGKWPIVVALAGSGESGVDDKSHIENGALAHAVLQHPGVFCAVFVFPQTPSDKVWDTKLAMAALAAAKASRHGTRYEIDEHRQYAMGLSLGGFGVCDLLRHEKGFAGGVSFSGCLDDSHQLPTVDQVCAELKKNPIAPLWMFHGLGDAGGDAGGVDPKSSQVFWRALECASKNNPAPFAKHRYTEIPELGHCSWGCASAEDLKYDPAAAPAKNPLRVCNSYKTLGGHRDESGGGDFVAAYHWLVGQSLSEGPSIIRAADTAPAH